MTQTDKEGGGGVHGVQIGKNFNLFLFSQKIKWSLFKLNTGSNELFRYSVNSN